MMSAHLTKKYFENFSSILTFVHRPIDVHDVDSIFEDNFVEVVGANFLDFPFAIRVPRNECHFSL